MKNCNTMIHLLWCTIRPKTFIETHKLWIDKSKNKNITTYVAVNTKEHCDLVSDYLSKNDFIVVTGSEKIGVCYPSYQLSSNLGTKMGNPNQEDIVVFASDDFFPPEDWDEYLENQLQGKTGALFVRDGNQLPDSTNMINPAITIPIMTYSCLLKLNKIIYHPEYTHMFSDNELHLNLKELGLLIDNRLEEEIIFEHKHHACGKRQREADQYDIQFYSKWNEDQEIWNRRKNMSLEERLKV